MNAAMLIPAYKPDDKLISYVKSLAKAGFTKILVVDDGGGEDFAPIFDEVRAVPECVVLTHEVNCGKGRALKTGLSYYIENCEGYDGVITGDADGQHTLKDTLTVAKLMGENEKSLILGSRDFDQDNVPARSKFGNKMTSVVFKIFHGEKIGDTQTGLRGIPNYMIPMFIDIEGERYEYEMNMLVECAERKIDIIETPIETVYIDDNSSSHFNAVRDSIRIYFLLMKTFLMYIMSSLIAYLVDIIVFRILIGILPESGEVAIGGWFLKAFATAPARIASSVVNFLINKIFVFKKNGERAKSMLRYVILVVGVWALSTTLVWLFGDIVFRGSSENQQTFIKMVVDVLLVVVTFTMQRIWVFKKNTDD